MENPVPGKSMIDGSDLGDNTKSELQAYYDKTGGMAGGTTMLPGDGAADPADAARQNALKYVDQASQVLAGHLVNLQGVGSSSQYAQQAQEALRSVSDRLANGEGGDGIQVFPGGVYVAHLARRMNRMKKDRARAGKKGDEPLNIYTDAMAALKTAIGALGIYSERNPGGMPIDVKEAKKIWFGAEQPDGIKESEWRTLVELGDKNIDPKRIRKFVNYDGSSTWELLNEDKTVMSRFTMGEYKGTKVFTQGGYSKFAEVLKQAQNKLGPDQDAEFSAMRGRLMGG